ncbi:MAG TPA: hypothetical protein EYP85_04595 [Armatimonadetes bacterium]|nr:hypothetical protein [Armatimonadota bacterium]
MAGAWNLSHVIRDQFRLAEAGRGGWLLDCGNDRGAHGFCLRVSEGDRVQFTVHFHAVVHLIDSEPVPAGK